LPEHQVLLPDRIRRRLGTKPVQKIQVFLYDNRIEMIPVRPARELRGFLKGIDTAIERELIDPECNCLRHACDV
jgi:bifunctional DNA-binding transcriptional regulator/antitoxin component of YhaV-PrlF toxin-antitoxin module